MVVPFTSAYLASITVASSFTVVAASSSAIIHAVDLAFAFTSVIRPYFLKLSKR
jgi:hypothetical protein